MVEEVKKTSIEIDVVVIVDTAITEDVKESVFVLLMVIAVDSIDVRVASKVSVEVIRLVWILVPMLVSVTTDVVT